MVYCGIDCIEKHRSAFTGKRLGLLTSVSGVNGQLESSVDILHRAFGLTALFSPEHGVRGNVAAGELVDGYTDEQTGLPVYSLYRKDSKRFTAEMLNGVDAVIYDIADVGVRYYTFISSLLYTLEDCAAAGCEVIVLDRPDPLGGLCCEGNVQDEAHLSFVGAYPLCMRYGLTPGELARLYVHERKLDVRLTVIPCEGWKREQFFPDTGRLWMMPSMGIPRFDTALLYAGMCLFEGTNVSEGRGTTCPFELIGAPYLNAGELARRMNGAGLKGVLFTAAYFTPTVSKHAGIACQGVHAHITDRRAFEPVRAGLTLLYEIMNMGGERFAFLAPFQKGGRPFISLLMGCDAFERCPPALDTLLTSMEKESAAFQKRKLAFHLY